MAKATSKSQFRILRTAMSGIHAVEANSAHSFPRHTHDQFGIGVLQRGAQRSLSGRGMVEAVAGDIITVNPGEVHDGVAFDERGRAWRMLYIDPAVLQDLTRDVGEGGGGEFEFTAPVLQHPALSEEFQTLFLALTQDGGTAGSLESEAIVLRMFAHLAIKPKEEAPSVFVGNLKHARSRIDDAPGETVTLHELAGLCGLSRFQFLRGFSRLTGLTPHAYLMQKRLAMARRLIVEREPLAEVAALCSFADQSHMTRLFARQYGVTPGAYAASLG